MQTVTATHSEPSFTPKRLILDLLDADPEVMGSAQRLLAAGEVFNFSHNQMRVALSRLVAAGLLANARRGYYELTGTGDALRREIREWRRIESRLSSWPGSWCAVLTHNLAAEGSSQFRSQSRALWLRGLRRWRPGLWVRPNNLAGGLPQLSSDLQNLGLDALQGSFLVEQPDKACDEELRQLWDCDALNAEYVRRTDDLRQAQQRLSNAYRPENLVETVQLGGDTIRFLLKDPLLPEAMVDSNARRGLVQLMNDYDRDGRLQWQQFISTLETRS